MLSLTISSLNSDYQVDFLNSENEIISKFQGTNDFRLIIDRKVYELYKNLTKSLNSNFFIIDSNEMNKSLIKVSEICEWLITTGATKSTELIGIGGGVVQDLTTFVSHIYYRGIKWHFIPTTLLSQADSSIGAKCALNTSTAKNQIGVIHAPTSVTIYPQFCATLPNEEIRSGFGEILKLSVTGPEQFYEEFKEYIKENGIDNPPSAGLVRKSLKAKQQIIEVDEYESNLRRILNYGHSFGHALETLTKGKLVHGDAIVVGMDLINYIGVNLKVTDKSFAEDFHNLINRHFMHIQIPKDLDTTKLVNELNHDKKMANGVMNFAIPINIGKFAIVSQKLDDLIMSFVEEYFAKKFFTTY